MYSDFMVVAFVMLMLLCLAFFGVWYSIRSSTCDCGNRWDMSSKHGEKLCQPWRESL